MIEKEDAEFLIESLWILENDSGICVFEEYYNDFTKEGITTDLIASFLSALLSFADEAFTDEIQHIQFSNRKIIFEFSDYVLFVIAIHADAPVSDFQVKKLINKISQTFNEKFQYIFENGKWEGDLRRFEPFSDDLKRIVKKEPLKFKILQLLDVKDHLKKVESFVNKQMDILHSHKEKIEYFFDSKKRQRDSKKRIKHLLDEKNKLENKIQKYDSSS